MSYATTGIDMFVYPLSSGTPSPSSSNSSSPGGRRRQLKLQESSECVAVFGIFLRYLYTAEISITVNSAVGILCLADKYNVDSLKVRHNLLNIHNIHICVNCVLLSLYL